MSITKIFMSLSPFLRDRFCSEVFTLGLTYELNEPCYRARCKRLMRQHNGKTRQLYKALSNLTSAERERFFNVISGVEDYELVR